MLHHYWITARIKNDADYDRRYDGFVSALTSAKHQGFWSEPTSFWLADSEHDIDGFVSMLKKPLDAKKDILLVRKIASDACRYFGAVEHVDVLLSFIPTAKKSP